MTTATKLTAFHGKQELKDERLARVAEHRRLDNLQRMATGEGGKGCAVWCTMNKYDHAAYETELGIPEWIARMEDHLFENLAMDEAMAWPEKFLQAIPVGKSDWDEVYHNYCEWLLADPTDGVIKFVGEFKDVKESIERVAMLHRERSTDDSAWSAARSAAWSAARSAAWSAAASAAESAADSAAWSAARSAAWSAAVTRQADKLIELLSTNGEQK